jgi:riboflavin kinase/FMN adenylyltransferase
VRIAVHAVFRTLPTTSGLSMHVIHGFDHVPLNARGASLAIGNFDGVHRGHQALLRLAADEARSLQAPAGVIVFEPHPRSFFQPERPHFTLTPLAQKLDLLEHYGMDMTIVLPFDQRLAALSPEDFVEQVLVAGLGVRHVVVGYDFHYGKGRAGTPQTLIEAGRDYRFGVTVVEQVAEHGEIVSSSAIRAELALGDVQGAAALLGHRWSVAGEVVSGAKRGTGLGFPTANIRLPKGTALAHGIYAVIVDAHGTRHKGAAYLGTRPTFDHGEALLETYLLDFAEDLYGRTITIEFVDFIRADRKFDTGEELARQMAVDVEAARAALAGLE